MAQPDAVIRDCGGVTWLDTRAMEWELMRTGPEITRGFFQKVLVRDADGEPSATLNYVPGGEFFAGLPYRHYHRSVREFAYVLEGEFRNCEYESAAQTEGDLIWKKKGYFLDRRPGSIHGSEAGPTSATGCVFINWRDGGSGIWVGERDYDTESVTVPYDSKEPFTPSADAPHEAGSACIRNRGGVTWLDTRSMAWHEMPSLPGYFQKVLVRDEDGEPRATLNYVPPMRAIGDAPFTLPYRHYHRSVREFAFVLEGEYAGWEYESADAPGELVWKKQGYFMDRRAGSIHGIGAAEPTSATGVVFLCWRDGGSGVWFGERDFETESVHVP